MSQKAGRITAAGDYERSWLPELTVRRCGLIGLSDQLMDRKQCRTYPIPLPPSRRTSLEFRPRDRVSSRSSYGRRTGNRTSKVTIHCVSHGAKEAVAVLDDWRESNIRSGCPRNALSEAVPTSLLLRGIRLRRWSPEPIALRILRRTSPVKKSLPCTEGHQRGETAGTFLWLLCSCDRVGLEDS
jgi:hypothetical protein